MVKKHQLISSIEQDWLEEIGKLSKSEKPLAIHTASYKPTREAFLSLVKSLANHHVSYKDWIEEIWIKEGIETKTILKHKDLFIKAASKFRETAHFLMQKLATTYKVNFESGEGIKELRILNNHINRVNDIDGDWKFNFHGYECLIWNTKTGQSLDIIFITRPEFGVLDPYLFLKYVNTTPEWMELRTLLEDSYEITDQALLTLEAYGLMDRVLDSHFSSRGLLVT